MFGTWILWLSIFWECHHPNWLIFFRGVGLNHQPAMIYPSKTSMKFVFHVWSPEGDLHRISQANAWCALRWCEKGASRSSHWLQGLPREDHAVIWQTLAGVCLSFFIFYKSGNPLLEESIGHIFIYFPFSCCSLNPLELWHAQPASFWSTQASLSVWKLRLCVFFPFFPYQTLHVLLVKWCFGLFFCCFPYSDDPYWLNQMGLNHQKKYKSWAPWIPYFSYHPPEKYNTYPLVMTFTVCENHLCY